MINKYFSKEEALQKAKQYCAYQERCHSEAKEKLYSFGMHKNEADELLSELISDKIFLLGKENCRTIYCRRVLKWI